MKKRLKPQVNILLTFSTLIIGGALFLFLPIAQRSNVKVTFLDALFTATSAVTITGLTTVDLFATYSTFGKIIIGLLMQLGGLSITTISVFILTIIGSKISYSRRDLARETVSIDKKEGILKTIAMIVKITFIIEFFGIGYFTVFFLIKGFNFFSSLGYATFHTISAFNNAGLTIFSDNNSLFLYRSDYAFNLATILLIILGGIGTLVIYDIFSKKNYKKFSFHTKIVLKMTAVLYLFGALSFYFGEKEATILNALFHSATTRTAGFYTYNYLNAKNATLLLTMLLMFIGGAPASTAGGIKITTLYTVFKSTTSKIKRKTPVSYKREIPLEYEQKAATTIFLTTAILLIGITIIALFDQQKDLSYITFESISAISNTGLSLNLTSSLKIGSKITLIFLMLIGRVGAITFISAFLYKQQQLAKIEYIEIDYLV